MRIIRNRLPIFTLLFLLGGGLLTFRAASAGDVVTVEEGIHLEHADAEGVTFTVVIPPLQAQPVADDGAARISLEGYGRIGDTGKPDLPQRGVLVGLPPGAEARVALVDSEQETVRDLSVAPAEAQVVTEYNPNDPNSLPQFITVNEPDPATYGSSAPFPAEPVVLQRVTTIRDQRVAQILIRPVQVRPAQRTATLHTHMTVTVDFVYPAGAPAANGTARPEGAVFERILDNALLNSNQAAQWRTAPAPLTAQSSPCLDDNAFRLTVTNSGIHQITHGDLVAAGLAGTVDPDTIRMCYGDAEMAIQVVDEGTENLFDDGDSILFYGEGIRTQETRDNIYWLTYGDAQGLRMGDSGAPGGGSASPVLDYGYNIHLEEDNRYIARFPSSDTSDHWYWGEIAFGISGSPTERTVTFDVPNVVGSHQASVTVVAYGHLEVRKHVLEIEINGNVAGEVEFTASGFTSANVLEATFPADWLTPSNNTLVLRAVDNELNPSHLVWLDWVEVTTRRGLNALDDRLLFTQPEAGTWEYILQGFSTTPLVLDVTDPLTPREVTSVNTPPLSFDQENVDPATYALAAPAGYLQPTSIERDAAPLAGAAYLQDVAQQIDYIIITDPLYSDALEPLRNLRETQGLNVLEVYVRDIFDEFSYGLYDPAAIRRFLSYAYSNWPGPAPTYVLLAGDGSYDHRDINGDNGVDGNRVPVYLRSGVDSNIGETAADNQYVDFTGLQGEEPDNLADMLLGRLPGQTVSEMANMVNRIVQYESGPAPVPWQGRHLFIADNGYEDPDTGSPGTSCEIDPAGDFFLTVNTFLNNHFPALQNTTDRLFYAPPDCYPEQESHYRTTPDAIQSDIVDAINQGRQFLVYTGHSGTTFWSLDGNNGFFNVNVVQNNLSNGDRAPIMLPMTCLEGSYHYPTQNSLSESLLKLQGGGAVASYAPTGLQVQQGHDFLIEGFYEGVFDNNEDILGAAVYSAKLNLFEGTAFYQDLQDTFMLLGDPAMDMRVWRPTDRILLPWIGR